MSLNNKRIPLAVRVRNASTLQEAMFEEGVDLVAGQLEIIFNTNTRELTWEEIEYIQSLFTVANKEWNSINFDTKSFEQLIEGKSRGARYLAYQVAEAEKQDKQFDMTQARKDWAATKELRYWAKSHTEDLTLCGLGYEKYLTEDGIWKPVSRLYDRWNNYNAKNAEKRFSVDTGTLLSLGIRYAWQAERFLNLYKEVMNAKRSWRSCYQVNQEKVLQIATTPNYNKLPLWVKKAMVNADAFEVHSDRIGNIWRLRDCARAWKWCGNLPKGIAERVGRMPVKSRFLAKLAWEEINQGVSTGWKGYHSLGWKSAWRGETYDRHELTKSFWAKFRELSRMSFVELLPLFMVYGNGDRYIPKYYQTLLEVVLELPYQTLPWNCLNRRDNQDSLLLGLADYLSPQQACKHLFGVSGKATLKAFQTSQPEARQWAVVLAHGNADLLQKYFTVTNCIEFEEDAIAFLKSLSSEVALRMIQTTEFKVRGEVHPVDSNTIRDTGYLFKRLEDNGGVPNLGRVRCWLSVHEQLAKEYVNRLPDFPLKVNPDFQRVQGLCSVDGSWEIEIPTCNAQLKLWGQQLSHCVGGYGEAINSGRSIILAIREYGRVTHTLEMVKPQGCKYYECQQFYGYRNTCPTNKLRNSVLDALTQANLHN
jgi:hypothetical protein